VSVCSLAARSLVPALIPGKAVRVNITIDEALLEQIDRAAAAGGSNRSAFLADAARDKPAPHGPRWRGSRPGPATPSWCQSRGVRRPVSVFAPNPLMVLPGCRVEVLTA